MAEVNVEINGRKYRMACEDGQETHLMGLARRFDQRVEEFKDHFGEIGDTRLTVMAGIAVLDDLLEAERRLSGMNSELNDIRSAGEAMALESEEMEERFTKKLEEAARRIELAVSAIDGTGAHDDGAS